MRCRIGDIGVRNPPWLFGDLLRKRPALESSHGGQEHVCRSPWTPYLKTWFLIGTRMGRRVSSARGWGVCLEGGVGLRAIVGRLPARPCALNVTLGGKTGVVAFDVMVVGNHY